MSKSNYILVEGELTKYPIKCEHNNCGKPAIYIHRDYDLPSYKHKENDGFLCVYCYDNLID
jgi:hypothetical protein